MTWKVQLRRTQRETSESIDQYVFRLHNLAKQAYPKASEADREAHVNEQFILGLPSDIQFHLLNSGADNNLDKNIQVAKSYEAAAELAHKRRAVHTAGVAHTKGTGEEHTETHSEYSEMREELLAIKQEMREARERENINLVQPRRLQPMGHGQPIYRESSGRPGFNKHYFTCDKPGHFARECRQGVPNASDIECYRCHQKGHISRECPSNAPGSQL